MNGNHELYMKRCLELAAMGLGNTSPNPMVGSVIVFEEKIIGEGFHRNYGEAHAEVNAINSVSDKSFLKESTLYVNLEPCSHYGKTPPCAELIIKMGIPEVIIGTGDPNPLVLGKGVDMLKNAGIKVTAGVLEKECKDLNKRFFTFHKCQRPFIVLKWAETADGFIDKIRTAEDKPEWITNAASKILVHKWRSEEQSIMIGTNTALMDNPALNVREWYGKNPVRVVIDKNGRLPSNLKILDGTHPTIVYTRTNGMNNSKNLTYINIPQNTDEILFIMNHLYCNKISSVLIEGGAELINSIVAKNLWDETKIFTGKIFFNKGVRAPEINSFPISETEIDGVRLKFYKNITQTL